MDFVHNINIYNKNQKINIDQIHINENELPFLINVEITKKAPKKIH